MAEFNNKILRGGAQLFAGQIGVQLIRFFRNFILARLLVPEDFGVASTFAVTLTALELLSDLSLEKMIVRDPQGDEERFQATLTTLSMIRFALLGLAIYLTAGWLADIYDVPEAKAAYQIFALVPIIRMFTHLDMYRAQRRMNFNIEIYAHISSQIIGLIVATILAYLTRDFTAVLWGSMAQSLALVVITHIMASRPFRAAWDPEFATRALVFGWPLMVNGFVLMLVSLADRVLVGAVLGMTDLAVYTIAVLLVTVAGSSLHRVVSTVSLPGLSAVQDDASAFQAQYTLLGHVVGAIAVFFFVPITLLGSDVIAFIFGAKYLGPTILVGVLSIGMAIKFMRTPFVTGFLANSRTKDLMLSETVRIVGIILAAAVILIGGNLVQVAMAINFGECVAFGFCVLRMRSAKASALRTPFTVYVPAMAALGLALLVQLMIPDALILRFFIACLIVAVYLVWVIATVPALRSMILGLRGFGAQLSQRS